MERFAYNLQKSKQHSLNQETIRTIFLKGVRDEYLDILNVMGKQDISNLPFEEIVELCQNILEEDQKLEREKQVQKQQSQLQEG